MTATDNFELINKRIFLANYSAYASLEQTISIFEKLLLDCKASAAQYLVALPYAYLGHFLDKYSDSGIVFGVDHMLDVSENAFTASIAAQMLKEVKASFTLIDSYSHHKICSETNETIQKKITSALEAGISPFLCIWEKPEEYREGFSEKILREKIKGVLNNLTPPQLMNLNIIYEAPWIHALPYRPLLEELVQSYQKCKEILQQEVGGSLSSPIKMLCALPFEFEELPLLLKQTGTAGLYLDKAVLHPNQLHRMFATDLNLHGDFEEPVIPEVLEPPESPKTLEPPQSPEASEPAQSPEVLEPAQSPEASEPSESPKTLEPPESPEVLEPAQSPEASEPSESPKTLEPPESPEELEPPESPDEIEQPESPEELDQPENPEELEQPESPDEIEQPESPEELEQPESPEELEQPESPEELEQPESPDTVEQPESPDELEKKEENKDLNIT
jgi:triosephosphate isomerase